jgi:DNA-binding PadR family transcriptional regulator
MTDQAQLLPGTLDLLILKAVSLGPLHGYGVLLRIGQITDSALLIEQGALYPALFRLVRQGLLKASGASRITTGAPSFMSSPPPAASDSAKRRKAGIVWLPP